MKKKLFSMLALLCLTAVSAWADGYYLVGNMNSWTVNSQYKLVTNPGNNAEQMITLYFDAGAEFKVVYSADDAATTTWYPGDGGNKYVGTEGRYTVYFRSDYGGGDDWHYKCIYLAWDPIAVTPTENKNEWTFAMPDYDVELDEVEYYTDLKEDEAIDYSTIGTTADIWLCRTLKAGSWNTFSSPVTIDADGITALGITAVRQLSTSSFSEGKLTLNFTEATTIEAGKPYLVKVSADKEVGAFDGATVSGTATPTETTDVNFVPTLGLTEVTGDVKNILFIGAENKLLHPSAENQSIKGFRAYFQLKGEAATAPSLSFALNLGDGDVTGVNEVIEVKEVNDDSWYTLDGRKLSGKPAMKGVYIVNGKKVIK